MSERWGFPRPWIVLRGLTSDLELKELRTRKRFGHCCRSRRSFTEGEVSVLVMRDFQRVGLF